MAKPITLTTDGLLLNWLKEVGEAVKAGDIVAEIEADKATVEIEAESDGILLEQSAQVGDELEEGSVIGTIGVEGEAPASSENDNGVQTTAEAKPGKQAETENSSTSASGAPTHTANGNGGTNGMVAATTPDGRVKISPIARNMAEDKGIDINQVQGSGPGGRIVKSDIENYTPSADASAAASADASAAPAPAQPGAAPVSAQSYGKLPQGDDVEVIEISRMRRAIAETTITSNQTTPHFFVTVEMDMAPLLDIRKTINAELEAEGVKVSVNDLLVKATALTLTKFPNLNTHYYGDRVVRHKRIHVGIAVALPNNGLLYVVSKDADKTALSVMAQTHKAMIGRAREGKVKPDDIKGATFSTSNLGPFGVEHFSAIISPPEAGIVAFGSAKPTAIVLEDGTLGVANRMKATISVDHRVSDGAEGAEFMQEFRNLVQNPMRLLV